MNENLEIPLFLFYDAAILTLTQQVEWGYFIRPACLPPIDYQKKHLVNKRMETAGWGWWAEPPSYDKIEFAGDKTHLQTIVETTFILFSFPLGLVKPLIFFLDLKAQK